MEKAEIVLREYLETVLDDLNYKPRKVLVKPVSSGGANYTSGLFKVTVTSPNKEKLHLFSKVGILGQILSEKFGNGVMFLRERLVYEDLKKEFDKIQNKYHIPKEERFPFAKYYGSNINPGCEVFIFEDLNERGFQIYDRFSTMNWNHASENIKVLAKLHSLSMALEKENPEVIKKVMKEVFPIDFMLETIKGKTEMYMEGLSENHKNLLRSFFKNEGMEPLIADFYKLYGKHILIHGDYRPSNIMYKEDGETVTVIPVDFQTLRIGCALSDILYFFVSATDGELRKNHFEQLMDLYYSQLSLRLAAMDIDVDNVYPRKQFDDELKKMLPAMLPMAMTMYPVIYVSPDEAPDVTGDADMSNFLVRPSSKSSARLTEIIEDFIRWKYL